MVWIGLIVVILVASGVVGLHLGRFREAYTEMTGMMVGMTMGMLNGFMLGYAAAAAAIGVFGVTATVSLFWGNLVGILLGILLGGYMGRAGGLMGVMDGAMGGLMGGSMGAMLAAMLTFPEWALVYTAFILVLVYALSMGGLVLLIERSAPGHAALHLLAPYFARAVAEEIEEAADEDCHPRQRRETSPRPASTRVADYYALLGVARNAPEQAISDAYLVRLAKAPAGEVERIEIAFSTLADPARRAAYDRRLGATSATATADAPAPAAAPTPARVAASEPPRTTAGSVTVKARAPQKPAQTARAKAPVQSKAYRPGPAQRGRARAPQRSSVGPIISGGLVGLVLLVLFMVWFASRGATAGNASSGGSALNALTDSGRQLPDSVVQRLQAQAVAVPTGSDGVQTLDFKVNGDTRGYNPAVLRVKQGVPVRFNISVEGRDPGCGRFVGIRGLGVHGIATPGETSTMEFTPSQAGIFQINCNMQMMDPGYLIVSQ